MTVQQAFADGIQAVFYASWAFIAVVSVFWPWWKTLIGWSVVLKAAALGVAVMPAMLDYWFGPVLPAWLNWVSVAGLWAVPPILVFRAIVVWIYQRTGRPPS